MIRWCLLLVFLLGSVSAQAASFVVEDIEVRGIKKIAVGTVLNYLPVSTGERFQDNQSSHVIRELYNTGFFDNIQLMRDGNTLIIDVVERPAIAEVEVDGNKEVSDENLEDALKNIGMTKGKIYNPKLLDTLKQELQQLYYSLGKYAVRIDATATNLDVDRVSIKIDISEGAPAKIRRINLIGNQAYDDEALLDEFDLESTDRGWFPSDKYSSVKLSGDLESLKSFYLDNGYIEFNVDSKQVTITPDKRDINISVNITEGDQYRINQIFLTGDLVVAEAELLALLKIREGEVFSRKQITSSIQLMTNRLGEEGYAYARINPIPKVNKEDQTIDLTLLVEPGDKMVVRRIQFEGNTRTRDYVLRRELRQMEGAQFSQSRMDRSKVRLQRLKYIGAVQTRYNRVSEDSNLMDVTIAVTERFSGSFTIGAGYSQAQGALLNLGVTHDNVFGTGNQLGVTFNNNRAQEQYEFSYLNPYWTDDGISRGFTLRYTKTDAAEANISNYLLDKTQASMNFGIPLSEYNSINFSFGFERNSIQITEFTSDEVKDFIVANNQAITSSTGLDGDQYNSVFASMSFSKDSRNRLIFPDRGSLNSVGIEWFGGDLDYYKTFYRHQTVLPVVDDVTFSFKGRLGYGESAGDTTDLPFFEKYQAGGVRTVRGYDFNSLGPRDSRNESFGGNFQVISSTEFLFAIDSLGGVESFRLGLYFDAGNVFATTDDFDSSELRTSVGISAKWFTAIGPIELSYANPINDQPEDDVQKFQFSLGALF